MNLHPASGAELGRLAGTHLIRVSSPSAAFTTTTCVLTVTQPSHAQSISGTVFNGATPVPYAGVALLYANSDGEFVLGVVANAFGQFSVNAPAGSYQIFAVQNGYVANMASAPTVVLGAGTTPTQNLQLTPATTSISGKVADAAATTTGLPGVQLFIQSQAGLLALLSTAADGTYTAPVTADTADMDADGIPNLLEYALGLSPLVSNATGLPVAGTAADHLTLTFNRAAGTTDITYRVEAVSNLGGAWTEIYSATGPTVADQVTVTDPPTLSGNPRRFLRLKVATAQP